MKFLLKTLLLLLMTGNAIKAQVQFNLGTASGVTYSPNVALPATYTNPALIANSTTNAASNFTTFNTVAAYIRNNISSLITKYGSIIINIPSGTFYINGQNSANNYVPAFAALDLGGCKNIKIKGAGIASTIITYTTGIKYGRFDATCTNPSNDISTGPTNTSRVCFPHHFIYLNSSPGSGIQTQNIEISDFEVNGKCDAYYIGGLVEYDFDGITPVYQRAAAGIQVGYNCSIISIHDVNIHHMGLDGVHILGDVTTTNTITIKDSKFEYNGRQGLSWVGGNSLTVDNCQFNYSGKGGFFDPPGAGIDIEPLNGDPNNACTNGTFNNCSATGNHRVGLLIPEWEFHLISKNMSFANCTFNALNDKAVEAYGNNMSFTNCIINGGFEGGYKAVNSIEATKFQSCTFSDNVPSVPVPNTYLLKSFSAKRMSFDNCHFNLSKTNTYLFYLNNPSNVIVDFNIFRNCDFNYLSSHNVTDIPNYGVSYLYRIIFDGSNSFTNNSSQMKYLRWSNIYVAGNSSSCNSNSFNLSDNIYCRFNDWVDVAERKITLGYDISNGTNDNNLYFNNKGKIAFDGATYTTNTDNLYPQLNIGSKTIFRNYASSSIEIGKDDANDVLNYRTVVNLNGKLIVDPSATVRFGSSKINTANASSSEIYIHKNAVFNQSFGSNFLSSVNRDGGNSSSSIPSNFPSTSTNEALNFNGSGKVTVPYNSKFDFLNAGDFSIEIAFKATVQTSSKFTVLFHKSDVILIGLLPNSNSSGNIYVYLVNGGAFSYGIPGDLYDGKCHSLTLTSHRSNGVADMTCTIDRIPTILLALGSNPSANQSVPIFMGSYGAINQSTLDWKGWIGQVRIWNKLLTADEMCYNYKRKSPMNTTGLIANWDMRDNGGATVTDYAANPVNGTLGGTTLPTWLTQNDVGDCFTATNNPNTMGSFRPVNNSSVKVIYYENNNILDNSKLSISTYPNPNKGSFTVQLPKINIASVLTLQDMSGKIVYTRKISKENSSRLQQIDLPYLSKGMYILNVKNEKDSYNKKIVIQ